ncbi:MAG: hypothetical protein ACOC1S_01880, partial [bacterium]
MGSFALADDEEVTTETAELEVGIEIGEYFEMAIVSDLFEGNSAGNNPLMGLFNEENVISGEPGYYVSDGNATAERAKTLFGRSDAPLNAVDQDGVEMIVVAANTDVNLDMNVAWGPDGKGLKPELMRAFFRFSSDSDIGDEFDEPIDISETEDGSVNLSIDAYNMRMDKDGRDFNNNLLERGNISLVTYNELVNAKGLDDESWGDHQGYVASFEEESFDSIEIPYRECTPSLVHINGAVE